MVGGRRIVPSEKKAIKKEISQKVGGVGGKIFKVGPMNQGGGESLG